MTLTITVQTHIGPEMPPQRNQVEDALAAIGFTRSGARLQDMFQEPATATAVPASSVSSVSSAAQAPAEAPASVLDEPSVKAAVQRERGKPAPGRKRRTAEEVAEDEAAEKTDPNLGLPKHPSETQEVIREVVQEAAEKQAVSSGEARVGPEDEPAEDQIQDIADEHAEAAAAASDAAPATLEDVRGVVGEYVSTFGMPAVQADGAKILEGVLGPVPADLTDTKGNPTKVWPLAKVPDGKFGDVVAAFRKALVENPFSRDRVSA